MEGRIYFAGKAKIEDSRNYEEKNKKIITLTVRSNKKESELTYKVDSDSIAGDPLEKITNAFVIDRSREKFNDYLIFLLRKKGGIFGSIRRLGSKKISARQLYDLKINFEGERESAFPGYRIVAVAGTPNSSVYNEYCPKTLQIKKSDKYKK